MQAHKYIKSRLRLTPAPSTSREVWYIYECFKKLGVVSSFYLEEGNKGLNQYGNHLTVMISLDGDELDPFSSDNGSTNTSTAVLAGTKARSKAYLNRVLALPRLQYVEKYPKFFLGERSISFKYQLKGAASKHWGVEITESNVNNPFCVIQSDDMTVVNEFKRGVRFNFEKFTKIEVMRGYKTNESTIKPSGKVGETISKDSN